MLSFGLFERCFGIPELLSASLLLGSLTQSDDELENVMRGMDEPDDERGEAATSFVEAFRAYEEGLFAS